MVEMADAKGNSTQLAVAQGQLVEMHKQISDLQSELALAEMEHE